MGRGEITHAATTMTRRDLLATTVPMALAAGRTDAAVNVDIPNRPRIAALVTEYRKVSHGQGIIDRFLDGYGYDGRHYRPTVDIVSMYVDQRPASDLTREREQRHPGLKVYPTIAGRPHARHGRACRRRCLDHRRARQVSAQQ